MYNPIATQVTITYNETYSLQHSRTIATISYRVAISSKYCNANKIVRNATQIVATMVTYCNRFTNGCDNTYLLQRSSYLGPRNNVRGENPTYRNQKCKWLRKHPLLQPNGAVATKKRGIRVKT